MYKFKYAIAAQGVIIDQRSNALSIFNIYEEISSPKFPVVLPNIDFVCVTEKESSDPDLIEYTLDIRNNDDSVFDGPIKADFQTKNMNRTIVTINGLPIKEPGIVSFSVLHNGEAVAKHILVVKKSLEPTIVQK
jgi:hypothetical protein